MRRWCNTSIMFRPPLVIESEKILLRPPREDDCVAVFRNLLGDPEVTRWLSFTRHHSEEESLAAIRRYRYNWHTGVSYAWVAQIKAGGSIAGIIEMQPHLPRVEIGVISSNRPEFRRRSAGLQVLRKLIDWTFTHPEVHRVHAFCAPEGRAATAMGRLGFRLEARLSNWEYRPNGENPAALGDSLLFAMMREPSVNAVHA